MQLSYNLFETKIKNIIKNSKLLAVIKKRPEGRCTH